MYIQTTLQGNGTTLSNQENALPNITKIFTLHTLQFEFRTSLIVSMMFQHLHASSLSITTGVAAHGRDGITLNIEAKERTSTVATVQDVDGGKSNQRPQDQRGMAYGVRGIW